MPDLFAGDTASASTAITDDSSSLLEQVKLKAAEVTKSFMIDMWLARITPDKVMPILHRVIDAAREQYADAIKQGRWHLRSRPLRRRPLCSDASQGDAGAAGRR